MPYANNKGADQPAQAHSLISAFVVGCLDSIISPVSNHNFMPLSCFCGCAGQFESYLVANTEDRFSRNKAHIVCERKMKALTRLGSLPDAQARLSLQASITVPFWR